MKRSSLPYAFGLCLASLLMGGCDRLGIPDPAKTEAQAEADGKAVGSACRHAGRAIEDCFNLNPTAVKSAVFAGWKEMNDYMVENKIAEVTPVVPPPPPPGSTPKASKKSKEAAAEKAAEEGDSAKEGADKAAEEEAPPRKKRGKSSE